MRSGLCCKGGEAAANNQLLEETGARMLFALIPTMLVHKPPKKGAAGRNDLCKRFDQFSRGEWQDLVQSAAATSAPNGRARAQAHREAIHKADASGQSARGRAAQASVQMGEVSRGRHRMTGSALAPGTDETFNEMQSKRPQRPEPSCRRSSPGSDRMQR